MPNKTKLSINFYQCHYSDILDNNILCLMHGLDICNRFNNVFKNMHLAAWQFSEHLKNNYRDAFFVEHNPDNPQK